MVDGVTITTSDCLEFYVKLDYPKLIKMNKAEIIQRVSQVLIDTLDQIKDIKSIRHFDYDDFNLDFKNAINKTSAAF